MIYVFLAPGFEETEAIAPVDILRRAGCEVVTAATGTDGDYRVRGSHNIKITADIRESDVTTDNMEGVILPGGMPGTLNLEKSPVVRQSVMYCHENNLPVCAICAAPSIPGHMGLLEGKEAICFPGFESELKGARISENSVCADGNMLTAKGAGVAVEFGLAAVAMLKGQAAADKIRSALQCK